MVIETCMNTERNIETKKAILDTLEGNAEIQAVENKPKINEARGDF